LPARRAAHEAALCVYDPRTMRMWPSVVPLVRIVFTVSLPFYWNAQGVRDERAAVEILRRMHEAQEAFAASYGGYATDLATLVQGCPGGPAPLAPDVFTQAEASGYLLTLRAAEGADLQGVDCRQRPLASSYYLAAAPDVERTNAHRAYAMRHDGRIFL